MYNDERNKTLSELRKQTLFRRFAFILLFVILAGSLAGVGSLLFSNSSITDETGRGEAEVEVAAIGGAGTSTNPFLINSLADLQSMRDAVNNGSNITGATQGTSTGGTAAARTASYKLMVDIDFGAGNTTNWTPIGNYSANTANIFYGTFDGNQHIVKNMYINTSSYQQGFFGAAGNGAVIKNLGIVNANITTTGIDCGVLLGTYGGGGSLTIDTCFTTGKLTGNAVGSSVGYRHYGGIVGGSGSTPSITTLTISNCFNYADITDNSTSGGASMNGGIIGSAYGLPTTAGAVKIYKCFNAGTITSKTTSDTRTGGLFGYSYNRPYDVQDCYNVGKIVWTSGNHGGFDGGDGKILLVRCYNVGDVDIAFGTQGATTFTNCYYNSSKSTYAYGSTTTGSTSQSNMCADSTLTAYMTGLNTVDWYKRPNESSTDQTKMYYPELKVFAEHSWTALREYSKSSVLVSGPVDPGYKKNDAPTCTANTAVNDVPWIGNGTK